MKKTKIILMFSLAGTGILSFIAIQALADISDVKYPVSQLGNCKSETECRSYCDKPENVEACLNFAEQNNLMPKEEIEMAKKFAAAGNKGPGGCTGKDSCETYCNDISHIDECVSFAEQNNLMPPDELHEAQKVRDAIKRGVKPPACGSKKSCDSYCEDPSHMEECITFASEAGLMDNKELGDAQKMLQALKKGVKPPPCRGKEACDEYCQQPDNMEACMNFAIEAGFMPESEKENAQKMLSAIKKGVKPPNCRGKNECDSYCQSDEHFEECTNFAEAAGFMDAKDAEMARKTQGKGPGGCKGKEECEAFCNNKDNQEVCFKFAEDNNMIPEEELKKIKEGMNRKQEGIPQSDKGLRRPPMDVPEGIKSAEDCTKYDGDWTGDYCDFGRKECIRQGGSWDNQTCKFPEGSTRQGTNMPSLPNNTHRGPGGCSTPEECKAYCMANPDACRGSAPPGGESGFQNKPQISPLIENMDRGAEECGKQGGSWEGDKCYFRDPTMQNIGVDRGGEECVKQGGNWTGSSCNFPPPPPSESAPHSLLDNKYLGAIFRFLAGN